AVEGQMIGVLADDHLSEQTGPGQSLLDGLGEPLGDDDVGLACLAGVLGSNVLDDDPARGNRVELLADFLTKGPAAAAPTRAGGGRTRRRSRCAGSGLRPWPFRWGFSAAAGLGGASSTGPSSDWLSGVAAASARMSAAKSRSWSGSIVSRDRPYRWRSNRSSG